MTYNSEKTLNYLLNLDKTKDLDAIGFNMNEHLKISGKYEFIISVLLGYICFELNKQVICSSKRQSY